MMQRKRILECIGWIGLGIFLRLFFDLTRENMQQVLREATLGHVETKGNAPTTAVSNSIMSSLYNGDYNSAIKFVFVIGLEGTGHHLMGDLWEGSPVDERLAQLGLHNSEEGDNLRHLLFERIHPWDANGLWNAHCAKGHGKEKKRYYLAKTTTLKEKLVAKLSDMNLKQSKYNTNISVQGRRTRQLYEKYQQYGNMTTTTTNTTTTTTNNNNVVIFPINTIGKLKGFGEVSYPSYLGPCRYLCYPNLDLWYEACDMAHVDCEHLYLYRDPIQVLKSTTINRHFNPTLLSGMQLYMTMLHIIYMQLETYGGGGGGGTNDDHHPQSHRTIGCYNLFEASNNWREEFRFLGGWGDQNQTGYDAHVDLWYQPPSSLANESTILADDYFGVYMKPLRELHERVVRQCQKGLLAKRKKYRGHQ